MRKKIKKAFIVDNFKDIRSDISEYFIVLNGYDIIKKKNVFFLEDILSNNQKKYKKIFINKIEKFHFYINIINKNNIKKEKFDLTNFNSLLHPELLKENNDQLLLLKNLVLIDLIKKYNFKNIHLKTSYENFEIFIKFYSKENELALTLNSKRNLIKNVKKNLLDIYKKNKQIIYFLVKSKFFLKKKDINNKILFFGFLAHFNERYKDRISLDYWNKLDEFIDKKKIDVSWIYFYYPSSFLRSINHARNYINLINNKLENTSDHQLIDNYYTKLDVIICLLKFFFSILKNIILKKKIAKLFFNNNFLFLLSTKETFLKSIFGYSYFENILLKKTFNNFFLTMGTNNKIIYLMENQKWEKILNFYCFNKKVTSYGFPHSGIREMDFRYFLNHNNILMKKYLPSNLIVHSKDSLKWSKDINFNKKRIIKLESLRFLKNKFFNFKYKNKNNLYSRSKSCMIFLDIYDKNKSPILNVVKKLYDEKIIKNIYLKIHPTIDKKQIKRNYPFVKIVDSLSQAKDINFLITGSNTTASYSALYNNLPLFVYLRSGYLNMVPEFGKNKARYFYDYTSLKKELFNKNRSKFFDDKFHFNNDLIPLWKKFIINLKNNKI